jgi:hypothetical protein
VCLVALGRSGALAWLTLGALIAAVIGVAGPIGIAARFSLGVHAARFERRLRFLSFEHGDLIAQLLNLFRLPAVLLEQLDHRRALGVCNVRQLIVIGHGTGRTADHGELLPRILTISPSQLIPLPRLIEKLQIPTIVTGDSDNVTGGSEEHLGIGQHRSERSVIFRRNERSRSIGMGGQLGSEYAGIERLVLELRPETATEAAEVTV